MSYIFKYFPHLALKNKTKTKQTKKPLLLPLAEYGGSVVPTPALLPLGFLSLHLLMCTVGVMIYPLWGEVEVRMFMKHLAQLCRVWAKSYKPLLHVVGTQ